MYESFNIELKDGRNILAQEGTILNDIIKENSILNDLPVVLGKLNNKFYELGSTITQGGKFEHCRYYKYNWNEDIR